MCAELNFFIQINTKKIKEINSNLLRYLTMGVLNRRCLWRFILRCCRSMLNHFFFPLACFNSMRAVGSRHCSRLFSLIGTTTSRELHRASDILLIIPNFIIIIIAAFLICFEKCVERPDSNKTYIQNRWKISKHLE